jgi:hypothetical protein
MTVTDVAHELRSIADRFSVELLAASPESAARRPKPETWAPQEVLGHLIDSAVNNHQRFVRAQQSDALVFPGYEQNHWVRSQGYVDANWPHLVTLWRHLNVHLADVIDRIPAAQYSVPCTIGGGAPVTLAFLIADYLEHMRHHMAQIRERLAAA